jgi:predicted dehydrogenase
VEPVRWGILGTGAIAEKFATGLSSVPDATLAAIGSRARESGERFAARFGAGRVHGSYEGLANDPEIDIIYIATPHPMHHPNARLCLEAGKAVLCEKPFTINAQQAADLIALARERNVFLMEAMWTRFLPLFGRLRDLLAEGVIGEPRILTADFGFKHGGDATHRLFSPELAGGALLDVGVYVCSLASMIFGRPERIASLADLGETGVDEQSAITFGYAGGQLAQLTVAVRVDTPQDVTLMGTEGFIRIHPLWWKGTRLTISRPGQPDETIEAPFEGNGYNYEAAEAMRCLRAGLIESPGMPHAETLAIIETLDAIRGQWGLRYPME